MNLKPSESYISTELILRTQNALARLAQSDNQEVLELHALLCDWMTSHSGLECENSILANVLQQQQQQQQAMLLALRKWQQVFEHANWGVVVGSADGTTLEGINPAYARMHGYSVDELEGQPITMVYAAQTKQDVPGNIARVHQEGHARFETLHLHRDGHTFPVLVDATVVHDKAGEVLFRVVNVQDITESRRVHDELRLAKEFFEQTFKAAPVGMAMADIEGNYTKVNPAFCQFIGYSEAELLRMSIFDVTHPDDFDLNQRSRQRLFSGEMASFQMEKRFVHKDGHPVWALLVVSIILGPDGQESYSIGQMLDIDRQKAVEQALRMSEMRFRGVFNTASGSIATVDADGRLVDCNEAFCTLLGYTSEALRQMNFKDLTYPDDLAIELPLLRELFERKRESYHIEKRYIKVDGQIIWVNIFVSAIRDELGKLLNFIGVVIDIAERKRVELSLLESRQQLRALTAHQENLLEAERKRIAGEIHDELGQQLTALKMSISLLRLGFPHEPTLLVKLEDMRGLVDHSIQVVRHVASNLRPAALDLGLVPAIEWLVADFQQHYGIDCTLEVEGDDLIMDDVWTTAVFRVVQESLTNVARHAQASTVLLKIVVDQHKLYVMIRDDGCGFDSVSMQKKSTGFGLFGMRERILALGGWLSIDSVRDRGSHVTVELPFINFTNERSSS